MENPTRIKLNSDDALTLSYALKMATQFLNGQALDAFEGFKVRVEMKGHGDADVEQEIERLQNLLGYDA